MLLLFIILNTIIFYTGIPDSKSECILFKYFPDLYLLNKVISCTLTQRTK